MKRYTADLDLASGDPYIPTCRPDSGKHVAVVGAGPTGLAAAFHLRGQGHTVTLIDAGEKPGGRLLTEFLRGHSDSSDVGYAASLPGLVGDLQPLDIARRREIGVEFDAVLRPLVLDAPAGHGADTVLDGLIDFQRGQSARLEFAAVEQHVDFALRAAHQFYFRHPRDGG